MTTAPRLGLTIAGSDSCGGAGIQADLRTFWSHGLRGASAITALTAQEPAAVRGVVSVDAAFVVLQARTVLDALPVAAMKIGMLGTREVVLAVAGLLHDLVRERGAAAPPVVLDPVMVSESGAPLLDREAITALVARLLPLADVVTPNLHEAARLLGSSPEVGGGWSPAEQEEAARGLLRLGARAVLVKGGHRREGPALDVLLQRAVGGAGRGDAGFERVTWFESPRIEGRSTHGTGCTLAAAIASRLALGDDLGTAVGHAKRHVARGIERGLDTPALEAMS